MTTRQDKEVEEGIHRWCLYSCRDWERTNAKTRPEWSLDSVVVWRPLVCLSGFSDESEESHLQGGSWVARDQAPKKTHCAVLDTSPIEQGP